MCQPMRTNGRITRFRSYKIHVSLSEGWLTITHCAFVQHFLRILVDIDGGFCNRTSVSSSRVDVLLKSETHLIFPPQIRGVTEADLGRYECHANNAHGEHLQGVELDSTRCIASKYFLITLNIFCPPGSPSPRPRSGPPTTPPCSPRACWPWRRPSWSCEHIAQLETSYFNIRREYHENREFPVLLIFVS